MSGAKLKGTHEFPSIEAFLFNGPLYTRYGMGGHVDEIVELLTYYFSADGWCPVCKQRSTFKPDVELNGPRHDAAKSVAADPETARFFRLPITISCTRDEFHEIVFYLSAADGHIWKIGQSPSLADIAKGESEVYAKILSNPDRNEFHKAIGLAAHGVGIGSFVYLRRIFERLIQSRFEELKDDEGWNAEEFRKSRMDEKIGMIKSHLPDFLVEHKQIYGVLSKGIHELSEDECLGYFDILKMSIVEILEEDKRKKDKLERQKELKKALRRVT